MFKIPRDTLNGPRTYKSPTQNKPKIMKQSEILPPDGNLNTYELMLQASITSDDAVKMHPEFFSQYSNDNDGDAAFEVYYREALELDPIENEHLIDKLKVLRKIPTHVFPDCWVYADCTGMLFDGDDFAVLKAVNHGAEISIIRGADVDMNEDGDGTDWVDLYETYKEYFAL